MDLSDEQYRLLLALYQGTSSGEYMSLIELSRKALELLPGHGDSALIQSDVEALSELRYVDLDPVQGARTTSHAYQGLVFEASRRRDPRPNSRPKTPRP